MILGRMTPMSWKLRKKSMLSSSILESLTLLSSRLLTWSSVLFLPFEFRLDFLKSGWSSNTLWLIKCTARDRRRVSVIRLLRLREADYRCLEFQVHRGTLRVWLHNVKGDNEDDEENIKGDIERVEEQMRSCFIKNKRGKKRQLS